MTSENHASDPRRDKLYAYVLGDLSASEKSELEQELKLDKAYNEEYQRLRRQMKVVLSHQAPLPSEASLESLFAKAKLELGREPAPVISVLSVRRALQAAAVIVVLVSAAVITMVSINSDEPSSLGEFSLIANDGSLVRTYELQPNETYVSESGQRAVLRTNSGLEAQLIGTTALSYFATDEEKGREETLRLNFGEANFRSNLAAESKSVVVVAGENSVEFEPGKAASASVVYSAPMQKVHRNENGSQNVTYYRQPLSKVLDLASSYGLTVQFDHEYPEDVKDIVAKTYVDFVHRDLTRESYTKSLKDIHLVFSVKDDVIAIDKIQDIPKAKELGRFAVVALQGPIHVKAVNTDGSTHSADLNPRESAEVFGLVHSYSGVGQSVISSSVNAADYVLEGRHVPYTFFKSSSEAGAGVGHAEVYRDFDDGIVILDSSGQPVGGPAKGFLIQSGSTDSATDLFFRDSSGRYYPVQKSGNAN